MSMHRSRAAALWLLAAAGAYVVDAACAGDGQTSKFHPWVLVALFWGVALSSVAIRYLAQYLAQASVVLKGYWHGHAAQRADLVKRAGVYLTQLPDALRPSRRHLARGQDLVRISLPLLVQGWDAARRAWGQHGAGARRAPGVLIGWSRSALKGLRV